jgi:hypothetical protein
MAVSACCKRSANGKIIYWKSRFEGTLPVLLAL